MAEQVASVTGIRDLTSSAEDNEKIWQMWQIVFPEWPIERQRLETIFQLLPGYHHIHENGFCLSFLKDGAHGKIAAIGVLPQHRGRGLGTALLERAKTGLKNTARANGGELKSLVIGSEFPRFWPQMPVDFSLEVKNFFLHRGFRKPPTEPCVWDFYKDIRDDIAPPEVLEKVSKANVKFSPWSPELYEECMTKQRALFNWHEAYETLAGYNQFHEVLVAFDPDSNAQIGWTLMCSPSALLNKTFAFLPLAPSKDKTGLICAVGVDESVRGKGVGLAMMVKAIESHRERGAEGVFIDSVAIRGFYERLGFEPYWKYECMASEETT